MWDYEAGVSALLFLDRVFLNPPGGMPCKCKHDIRFSRTNIFSTETAYLVFLAMLRSLEGLKQILCYRICIHKSIISHIICNLQVQERQSNLSHTLVFEISWF